MNCKGSEAAENDREGQGLREQGSTIKLCDQGTYLPSTTLYHYLVTAMNARNHIFNMAAPLSSQDNNLDHMPDGRKVSSRDRSITVTKVKLWA
jgi:hypothetical protein